MSVLCLASQGQHPNSSFKFWEGGLRRPAPTLRPPWWYRREEPWGRSAGSLEPVSCPRLLQLGAPHLPSSLPQPRSGAVMTLG